METFVKEQDEKVLKLSISSESWEIQEQLPCRARLCSLQPIGGSVAAVAPVVEGSQNKNTSLFTNVTAVN